MIFIICIYDFDQPVAGASRSFLHKERLMPIGHTVFFSYLSDLVKGSFLGSDTIKTFAF